MARSFNGSSDRIGMNSAIVKPNWFTDSYSLSVWVKAAAQSNTGVYSEGNTTTNTQFWWIGPDSTSTSKMRWTGNNQPAAYITTATMFDSTWHHYALAVGSAAFSVYVDGVRDGGTAITSGQTGISGTAANLATLGSLGRTTYTNFFSGSIAELGIWTSKTLSLDDAKSLADGLSAVRLGPTHYWPLWGVDSPEPDIGLG